MINFLYVLVNFIIGVYMNSLVKLLEDFMFSTFLISLLIFFGAILFFKVFFFVVGVLLAGAGFIIKTIVILLVFIPVFPLIFLIAAPFISITTIILIGVCGTIISFLSQNDRKYNNKFN